MSEETKSLTCPQPHIASPPIDRPILGSVQSGMGGREEGPRPVRVGSLLPPVVRDSSNPWNRLRGESAKAFEAFTIFKNLGSSRTRAEVARRLGHTTITTISRWAVQFFWDHRVTEWDAHQDYQVGLWNERIQQEMVERHGQIALKMLDLVREKLDKINVKHLSIADITRWVEVATKLERICKGAPTSDTEKEVANIVQLIWQGEAPPWTKPKVIKGEIIESK